jgi:hypothetical protein
VLIGILRTDTWARVRCGAAPAHRTRSSTAEKVRVFHGFTDHTNVRWSGPLVKADGEHAIVLEITDCMQQPGGHMCGLVPHDGLVDLHFFAAFDPAVVGRILQPTVIIVIGHDGTIEVAGLEHRPAVAVAPRSTAMPAAPDRRSTTYGR